jgi:hypothetical protein
LHIDLIIHFITTFFRKESRGQLIFTSQNTALLKEKDILRRDAIWITERNDDGSTSLTSVAEYPVRKEHSRESIYRKGLIGGLPNLGRLSWRMKMKRRANRPKNSFKNTYYVSVKAKLKKNI